MSKTGQEDQLNIWVIEPHEPLIFRDGRPFNLKPGVIAQSLPFPFPSTTTGGVRTQAGLDEHGNFAHTSEAQLEALKQLKVRGPLLVQIPAEEQKTSHEEKQSTEGLKETQQKHEPLEWFLPAPADALLLRPRKEASEKVKARLKRLVPVKTTNSLTDLASSCKEKGVEQPLHLVGMQEWVAGKPIERPPAYWKWEEFQKWLFQPVEKEICTWDELGIKGPQQEQRVHVSMDGEKRKGKDTALFATRGMEFVASNDEQALSSARPLALAMIVDEDIPHEPPHTGFAPFGGERRLVHWWNCTSSTLSCPPEGLIGQISEDGACRMILLTPAYFSKGFYPTNVQKEHEGVTPLLKAIAIQRPQVVSGWDFVNRGPKKTRRLAPAGTVLFLKLNGTPEAVEKWVKMKWLQCISDTVQDCNDGFGLAVIGTWAGDSDLKEMEASK